MVARGMRASRNASDPAGQFGPDAYRTWRATSLGNHHRRPRKATHSTPGRRIEEPSCAGCRLRRRRTNLRVLAERCVPGRRLRRRSAHDRSRGDARGGAEREDQLRGRSRRNFAVSRSRVSTSSPRSLCSPSCPNRSRPFGKWRASSSPAAVSPSAISANGACGPRRRRLRGWSGAKMWNAAKFRSASELRTLVQAAKLRVEHVSGAIYYPRSRLVARLMAPIDPVLGELTTFGAAFVAVKASKA